MAGASGDGDAASAMERLWLHLAARSQRHRARELRPWRPRTSGCGSRARSTRSCSAPAPARTPRRCAGASKRALRSATFRCSRSSSPQGATDYLAQLFVYGETGDRSQGTGIAYSFATDRKGGFSDDDTTLVQATLPALSLAMKAHAGQVIASGLLGTYLGEDAGTAGPRRLDHARFGRQSARGDLVRRHPRLHADQRHGAGRPSSSNCSMTCSRS